MSRRHQTVPLIPGIDILLALGRSGDTLETALLYRPEVFEAERVERMSSQWKHLLEEILNAGDISVADLDILPAQERSLLLELCAGDISSYPQACLHQLFEEQVNLRPEAEAVVFGTDRLTYQQLDHQSNRIARFLLAKGIGHGDRVGVFMNRSADMIVAIMGILKAGSAYVPIDPDYPVERLKFIAEDSAVKLVLSQRSVKVNLPVKAPRIFVDSEVSPVKHFSSEPVANRANPESVAAVIYTSGSTGLPKAACIPHRAIVRTVRNTNYIEVDPGDRVGQASSPSFDAAIKEIWLPLVNGATLVGVPRQTLLGRTELTNLLQKERISVLILNTSYVQQIARESPEVLKGVRKVIFGGEAAEPEPLRKLLKYVGPGVLTNGYGPTEGCVITTYHDVNEIPEEATTIPIGRPVSNTQVYLLDDLQRPVPIGIKGEIYIGGEGVAHGYLNRPDLTEQRFLPDTFSIKPGRLLYRTGDFARMRRDGLLEFLGRTDDQVKIRGHRIELAEVRQAIAVHPDVKQIFLMVREDQPGDKRLIAYLTLHRPLATAQEVLAKHARAKLPAHMLPAAFVILNSIPLNTNGKVDRKALPAPSYQAELTNRSDIPGTDLQCKLTQTWQEVLRMDHVGPNDNFFDLGGHSLLAARLITQIEKVTGLNIPVATLFEAPTIGQLAEKLERRTFAAAWSPLVRLFEPKRETAAPPFFCVHSLGANLVTFHKVASFMGEIRPVYGLQPHGLDGLQEPLDSIEAIASAYLAEVRRIQPQGPYHFGGMCIGGVVAFEMAQQLKAAGEEVALLALIDSFLPGHLQHLHSRHYMIEYLDQHLGDLLRLSWFAGLRYLGSWLADSVIRFGRLVGIRDRSSLAQATRRVAIVHIRAVTAYQPRPYSGKMVQLMCSDAPHRAYEDRRLAWSSLTASGLQVRLVPGNHLTMLEEPHAQVLAHELEDCLSRASSDLRLRCCCVERGT